MSINCRPSLSCYLYMSKENVVYDEFVGLVYKKLLNFFFEIYVYFVRELFLPFYARFMAL